MLQKYHSEEGKTKMVVSAFYESCQEVIVPVPIFLQYKNPLPGKVCTDYLYCSNNGQESSRMEKLLNISSIRLSHNGGHF